MNGAARFFKFNMHIMKIGYKLLDLLCNNMFCLDIEK